MIRKLVNHIIHFRSILQLKKQDKADLKNWLKMGLKLPPPEVVKHNIIIKYAKKERIKVLVSNQIYINLRLALLVIKFKKIIGIVDSQSFINELCLVVNSINEKAIVWIDSQFLLQYNSKDKILEKIKEMIKLLAQSELNHTILWDNADLFLHHSEYPTVQELKTLFLEQKPFYSAMKTENNVFVMSLKL